MRARKQEEKTNHNKTMKGMFNGFVHSILTIITKDEKGKIIAGRSYTIAYKNVDQAKEAAMKFINQFNKD